MATRNLAFDSKAPHPEISRPGNRPRDDTIFFCHPERAKRPRDLLLILKDLKLRSFPSGDAPRSRCSGRQPNRGRYHYYVILRSGATKNLTLVFKILNPGPSSPGMLRDRVAQDDKNQVLRVAQDDKNQVLRVAQDDNQTEVPPLRGCSVILSFRTGYLNVLWP
ncbi:hypothetical protein SDC9_147058 [bioreactor metagenome]|uniref:Uncharacterized protein n=1 Tax=bioreactor metagenome TaxID=1076179 RepID=A0A645EGI1_9ZZZZ